MRLDVHSLPDDPTELKHIIATLSSSYQDKLHHLEEQVRLLRNESFGRKSEKHLSPQNERQQRLFDETDDGSELAGQTTFSEESPPIRVAPHQRRKAGRKPLPADLPRIEVIHDLAESEKQCACGTPLSRIGEEVCEKLDIIPAKVQVIRHIRYKYACKGCEGVESLAPTVRIAPLPPQLIPKTMATAGLLAQIVVSKIEDALPFHRQSKQLARLGIDLPRATLCNWARQVAERASPLADLMDRAIREGPIVNIDETTVQVLQEPDRADTQKSYMWIFRGGDPERPVLRYQYHPTRAGSVPLSFLDGFKGYVQTDGYNGYDALGRRPGIVMVGCWAHARRKFHEVLKAASPQVAKRKLTAEEALEFIGKLYRIEKEARLKELPAPTLCELRQQQAKPVLEEFKHWLEEKAPLTPPGGLLGKAIGYTLNQWPRLIAYLQDGRLRPDNNLVENAIRPFVVGRKNWLFSGHPRGAEASAFLYSLIETAKANGLNVYLYMRHLFDRLPLAKTEEDYRNLLPPNLDSSRLNSATA
jgi:transposase